MKKYTQSKHQSKKSANQKTIKQQKPFHRKMENSMLKKPQEAKKRTWQWPPRNNILSAIMAPRKNQPPRSLRPRTKKTVYEKCRSRGSQIGFKSLPFWMLQVFSTIAIYMASFFNLLPQWVSLHSTSALSKSNRCEKLVSEQQQAGKNQCHLPPSASKQRSLGYIYTY